MRDGRGRGDLRGGCAAAENGSPAAPEQPTITVDSLPSAEEGELYVAADGSFKQQGLTVKIKSITGGEEGIPDLQSGKAQLVGGNYVPNTVADFNQALDEAQEVAGTNREALGKAMERHTGLQPIIADTMPYDAYPLNMAETGLQRVSNAMFESGLTRASGSPTRCPP
ncbi:MAG TPA: hypothetical protein VF060_18815 [Trebonia sp.]